MLVSPILAAMGAEGRATSWPAAARAVALLALLVGLLAMHGLGGAQHHAPPPDAHAATSPPAQHIGHAVSQPGHAALAAVSSVSERVAAACHDDCAEPGVAALCLAVLTAVVVALLAAARARACRAKTESALRRGWTVRAPPPLRFDLVADLCVSRT